jgi:AraC-like DNA-binding protein/mannose-6-phosphate isomerase-like protein (cupin superfamily)
MTIEEILTEIKARTYNPKADAYPKYQDVASRASESSPFIIYPDKSRSIDDIISVFGMITSEGSPLVSMLNSYLLRRRADGIQAYFDDGLLTMPHTHNYAEFGYVAEGKCHVHVENQEYIFNKGEIFLIDRNTTHNENLYMRNSVILFISVANTFFDKTMHHDVYDSETEKFIKKYVVGRGYRFIRLIPKGNNCQVPDLFGKILSELWQPHPGTKHLIIGYVEWILNMLPVEYEIVVQQNDSRTAGDFLFKEIRQYIENNYRYVTLTDIVKQYGHNMNYFNRLIKTKTGMTFSAFVQNLKLEKAEVLLRTTDFPVEEIARIIGYENLSYFYKIFRKKFDITPHNLRKTK